MRSWPGDEMGRLSESLRLVGREEQGAFRNTGSQEASSRVDHPDLQSGGVKSRDRE